MTFTPEQWVSVIQTEYPTVVLDPNPAQPRKQGVEEPLLRSVFQQLEQTFHSLSQHAPPEIAAYTEMALHVASLLFSLGAAPAVWKKWLALSSFGYFLQHDLHSTYLYAVLADEWAFLAMAPKQPSKSKQTDIQCFEKLLGVRAEVDHQLPAPDMRALYEEYEGYGYNDYCVLLTEAVPAQDYEQVETCLIRIYEAWAHIDWDHSTPELYPEFEPVPCALAALAYQAGYRPRHLPDQVWRFYEPGLAGGASQNFYQKYFGS